MRIRMNMILASIAIVMTSCATNSNTVPRGSFPNTTYRAIYGISLAKVERSEKASSRYGEVKIDTITTNAEYKLSFEDDMVRVLWDLDSKSISFSIRNKLEQSIKVPWDEAAYIDVNGASHRVMHSGVKYNERSNPQAPSIIAKRSLIEDIVFPTDYVSWSTIGKSYKYSEWVKRPFFPDDDKHGRYLTGKYATYELFEASAKSNIGKSFQVLLPLQVDDVINEYVFTFAVKTVDCNKLVQDEYSR